MSHEIQDRLVLTVPEAADLLGICRNAAYEGVRRGEIPSIRIGKRLVVPRTAFEEMLRNGAAASRSDPVTVPRQQKNPEAAATVLRVLAVSAD